MKSELTLKIERSLFEFKKPSIKMKYVLIASEVMLPNYNVVDVVRFEQSSNLKKWDCITMTCYEIKISLSDFKSPYGHNLVGNQNYYVVPKELVSSIIDLIPDYVGIIMFVEDAYKSYLKTIKKCSWNRTDNNQNYITMFNAIKIVQIEAAQNIDEIQRGEMS